MKRKMSYSKLFTTGLITTTLFLSACQNSGQKEEGKAATGDQGDVNIEETSLSEEQNKFVVKDITTTALYKNHLSAYLKKMSKENDVNFEQLAQLKTWVVGPLDLKETVTGELAKASVSGSDIVAKQKQYEIFVNSANLEKLEAAEQAKIVRTQFFQGLVLLKNLSDEELCMFVKVRFPESTCPLSTAPAASVESEEVAADSSKKSESKKETEEGDSQDQELSALADDYNKQNKSSGSLKLTDEEEGQVRQLVNSFEENPDSIDSDIVKLKMKDFDFDLRIFSIKISGPIKFENRGITDTEETPASKSNLTSAEVKATFESLLAMTGQEVNCVGLTTKATEKCKLDIKKSYVQREGPNRVGVLTLKVLKADGTAVAESQIYQPVQAPFKLLPGVEEGQSLFVIPLTTYEISERVEGAKYRMNYLLVGQVEQENFIEGLVSVPGEVKQVEKDSKTEKISCVGQKVEGKDLSTDSLLASKSGLASEELTQLILAQVPAAPCW